MWPRPTSPRVRDRPTKNEASGRAPEEGVPDGAKHGDAERVLMNFRWGLIPWWSKDAKGGSRLINARRETVMTKSSFREAFEKRRINAVPAGRGYYE